jgi:hypothetical protein
MINWDQNTAINSECKNGSNELDLDTFCFFFLFVAEVTILGAGLFKGRVLTTTLQLATQRLLQPHFSNGMVACLRYEHCGATSVRV